MIHPIGIFDSGVGGLSVLKEIRALLPGADLLFFADQAHVPYGPRQLVEVRGFAESITRFLLEQGVEIVVVACNTASAAALTHLRENFPSTVKFVGMEPAVKPAAETTHSKIVGVLATPATFQGRLFASVVERFAKDVTVLEQTCPGLVERIEAGELEGEGLRSLLAGFIRPLVENGADTLVLGCTHYPLVLPLIEQVAGPQVRVINPAPAVARQTARLWNAASRDISAARSGELRVITTGNGKRLETMLLRLLGESGAVRETAWNDGRLTTDPT